MGAVSKACHLAWRPTTREKKENKGHEGAAEATRKGIKKPPESPYLSTSYSSAGQKLVLFKEKDFLISTTSGCK